MMILALQELSRSRVPVPAVARFGGGGMPGVLGLKADALDRWMAGEQGNQD